MGDKQLIYSAHALGLLFAALLLVGARTFLTTHALLAGGVLALFALLYAISARVARSHYFLIPADLCALVAWHLALVAAGLRWYFHPLADAAALALLYVVALFDIPRSVAFAAVAHKRAIEIASAAFALWILFSVRDFAAVAPLLATAALAGFAGVIWLRFAESSHPLHSLYAGLLSTFSYLMLLYANASAAVVVALAAIALSGAMLLVRKRVDLLDAALLLATSGLLAGVSLARGGAVDLGWIALAVAWLSVATAMYRRELTPLLTGGRSTMLGVMPLFALAIVAAVFPFVASSFWKSLIIPPAALLALFMPLTIAASQLRENRSAILDSVASRLFAFLTRALAIVYLVWLVAQQFHPSFRIALLTGAFGALVFAASRKRAARFLLRRSIDVYEAAAFFTAAYFVLVRRLAFSSVSHSILDSALPLFIVFASLALLVRDRAKKVSIVESGAIAVAIGAAIIALRSPEISPVTFLIGIVAIGIALLAYVRLPEIAMLYVLPVVGGYWLYSLEWTAGVRGESLGIAFFLFALGFAVTSSFALRKKHPWSNVALFTWFLCTTVALLLFAPYDDIGAYLAIFAGAPFLAIARDDEVRRDRSFAIVMEVIGSAIVAMLAVVFIVNAQWLPLTVLLGVHFFVYALLGQYSATAYYYPAAFSFVAAPLAASAAFEDPRSYLIWLLLPAIALLVKGGQLRKRGNLAQARPLDAAASAAIGVAALLSLALPYGVSAGPIAACILAYIFVFVALLTWRGEPAFLTVAFVATGFFVYHALPLVTQIDPANRIAIVAIVPLTLALLGRFMVRSGAAFAASLALAALTMAGAMFATGNQLQPSRIALLLTVITWIALLLLTRREVFIYLGTVGLAALAFNFVSTSEDVFGRHLVVFFLAGAAILLLVFAFAALRRLFRFRKPELLAPRATAWYRGIAYGSPVMIVALAVFGTTAVTTSSNPRFCGSCHSMTHYEASWKGSAHAKAAADCAACHYAPGFGGYVRAKMRGTSELVDTITGTYGPKGSALVRDGNCLKSGCHSTGKLSRPIITRASYRFNHSVHLRQPLRGPRLRCTSCHTNTGAGSHFEVDTNSCFTCHFQSASAPRPATRIGCTGCHGVPRTQEFDHREAGVTLADSECEACHDGITTGSIVVEERRCRHCHEESMQSLEGAVNAKTCESHVRDHAVGCDQCHDVIHHGRATTQIASR